MIDCVGTTDQMCRLPVGGEICSRGRVLGVLCDENDYDPRIGGGGADFFLFKLFWLRYSFPISGRIVGSTETIEKWDLIRDPSFFFFFFGKNYGKIFAVKFLVRFIEARGGFPNTGLQLRGWQIKEQRYNAMGGTAYIMLVYKTQFVALLLLPFVGQGR